MGKYFKYPRVFLSCVLVLELFAIIVLELDAQLFLILWISVALRCVLVRS